MLADFFAVIRQTPSTVLITYRPEYHGTLATIPGAQTLSLRPLNTEQTEALIGELLGTDASVQGLAGVIAERADGNPFFAEEMVRDLAERGAVRGDARLLPATRKRRRHDGARNVARGHRGPRRPPQPGGQAHTERRGGRRIAVQPRAVERPGDRPSPRRAGHR